MTFYTTVFHVPISIQRRSKVVCLSGIPANTRRQNNVVLTPCNVVLTSCAGWYYLRNIYWKFVHIFLFELRVNNSYPISYQPDTPMKDVAIESGMMYNGMGRGLLVFDYDNDGDEDVLVAGNVGSPKLFKNMGGNQKNWIKIRAMHK